jgi:hypothetical protein
VYRSVPTPFYSAFPTLLLSLDVWYAAPSPGGRSACPPNLYCQAWTEGVQGSMAMKFRLILTQNGQHIPRSDEPVFRSEDEAQKEKMVRDSGLRGVPDKGYKWVVVPQARTTSLVEQSRKRQPLAIRMGKDARRKSLSRALRKSSVP